MVKTNCLKGALDGIIYSVVLGGLLGFLISPHGWAASDAIIVTALCAILVTAVSVLFLWKEKSNKAVVLFYVISLAFTVMGLAISLVLPIRLFPVAVDDDFNNGYGILLLVVGGMFIFISAVFKLSLFLFLVIRNKRGQGDGLREPGDNGSVRLSPPEDKESL